MKAAGFRSGLTFIALVLGACGGGGAGSGSTATPASNPNDLSIVPTSVAVPAANSEFGAMIQGGDGGLWIAGAEKGLYGRAFMFKLGGTLPNPCGPDGLRWLDELTALVERHPIITVLTRPHDGMFYVGGKGPGGLFVSRYLESTCQPDPTFGTGGHALVPYEGLSIPNDIRVLEDASGRVVTVENNAGRVTLRRLSSSGVWDATFGDGGRTFNTNVDSFMLADASISPSGEIYVAGSVEASYAFRPAIWKLDANGHTAVAFGTDGIRRYPEISKGTGGVQSILVESDRLVFAGNTANSVAIDDIVTNDSFIAAADLTSGVLIPSFGHSGGTIWDWGFNNSNMIRAVIRNQRGGYTTCGHAIKSLLAGQSIALADFTVQGQQDSSVGYQGRRLVKTVDTVAGCGGMAYDGSGRLHLGGQNTTGVEILGVE